MNLDNDCPFCQIVGGDRSETTIIGEGADWLAFFPQEPATVGHTLVIPKHHVPDLWCLEEEARPLLLTAAIDIGDAIARALRVEDMNLITSKGAQAEQTVFHLHLHIVPRTPKDNFGTIWPKGISDQVKNSDLARIASDIRTALG